MSAAPDLRARQLRAIHAMRREIALADDSYRAIVRRMCNGRTDSSKDLTDRERTALCQELQRLGAGRKMAAAAKPRSAPPARLAPQVGKLRALWLSLWQLGVVRDPSDRAIESFMRRQTGIAAWGWTNAAHLARAIEALKDWCAREGFSPAKDAGPVELRMDLVTAQWAKLRALKKLTFDFPEAIDNWLDNYRMRHRMARNAGLHHWTAPELDGAIDALGRWIRYSPGDRGAGDRGAGDRGAGDRGAGDRGAGDRGAGEAD